MPASQSANFNLQEFTDVGQLMVGGRLYTYAYGTTAQKTAFTDPDGTVPHTYTADGAGGQYIALNARGELPAPLYLGDGSYDIALKRGDGSTVWTRKADGVDNAAKSGIAALIASLFASAGGSLVGFIQDAVGAVKQTIQDLLRETITVSNFGAVGDGVTDNTAAFTALSVYINTLPLTSRPIGVKFPKGVFVYGDGLRFTRPVFLYSHGEATLKYTGNAAAIKCGPDGISNFDVFLQGEYTIDGLCITGGEHTVHGIYMNEHVIEPRIRNVVFEDFGNAASYDIYAQFENWNVIIENCRKLTYSSLVAVGSFIAITGKNKAGSAYDGGNSRVTIRDCWMTSYSGQELGYFAYINATKSRVIGGGHQHSNGGILLGPMASGALIDGVYAELSTTGAPHYVQALSAPAGDGTYHFPQNVVIRNGYINMHKEVIGANGKLIKSADANVKLHGWRVEDMSIANFANGQVLVEQNNLVGQNENYYARVRKLFVPASSDDGSNFNFRTGYSLAEEWYRGDPEDSLSLGTPSRADATGARARLNIAASGAPEDSAINVSGFGDGYGYGLKSRLVNAATAGWHWRMYDGAGTAVGGVYANGAAVSYITSSDYRLKGQVQELSGSGEFIDALRPVSWAWKTDGAPGVGFIAHELQAVSPSSVTGKKDQVDAQGEPVYQGVEYGSAEVVANVVAEVQSLRKRMAAVEAAVLQQPKA